MKDGNKTNWINQKSSDWMQDRRFSQQKGISSFHYSPSKDPPVEKKVDILKKLLQETESTPERIAQRDKYGQYVVLNDRIVYKPGSVERDVTNSRKQLANLIQASDIVKLNPIWAKDAKLI